MAEGPHMPTADEHAEDDAAWGAQLGPAYTPENTARVLDTDVDTVEQDPRLLRLEMRSGRIGYPVFQFDGRTQVDGVGDVVQILTAAVTGPWTIASFLRSPQPEFDGREPIDLLRDGDIEPVLDMTRNFAARWGQ